jgi:predicted protein tyrosine phosphatase
MLHIMSQKEAEHAVVGKNVLMMNCPLNECDQKHKDRIHKIRTDAADCLYLEFHDIFCLRRGLVHPEPHHVRQALEWAKDKDVTNIIYICQAGKSRSAAMAYVLNSTVMPPSEVINMLTPDRHMPNHSIVSMGAELIGNPEIVTVYRKYVADVEASYAEEVPLEIIN